MYVCEQGVARLQFRKWSKGQIGCVNDFIPLQYDKHTAGRKSRSTIFMTTQNFSIHYML